MDDTLLLGVGVSTSAWQVTDEFTPPINDQLLASPVTSKRGTWGADASEVRSILDTHRRLMMEALDEKISKQEVLLRKILGIVKKTCHKDGDSHNGQSIDDIVIRTTWTNDVHIDEAKALQCKEPRISGATTVSMKDIKTDPSSARLKKWLNESITPHTRNSHPNAAIKKSEWRESVGRFLESSLFQLVFGLIIVLNSAFIGFQVEHTSSTLSDKTPLYHSIISWLFTFAFFVELLMRLVAGGFWIFHPTDPDVTWNLFDLLLVLTSLVELVVGIMELNGSQGNAGDMLKTVSAARLMRILRIARLIKMFRMVRIFRFVYPLRVFLISTVGTLMSLFWALLMLFMILYFFGVLFTLQVSEYLIEAKWSDVELPYVDDLKLYWGSLPRSILTLYKCISGGFDWDQPQYPLHVLGGEWTAAFLVYISFVTFSLLNVVTGVFCQNAIDTASQHEDLLVHSEIENRKMYANKLYGLFQKMDADHSGEISLKELEEHLDDERVQAVFDDLQVDYEDAAALFRMLDTEVALAGEKGIDAEEFVAGLMQLRGYAKRADVFDIKSQLKQIRKDIKRVGKVAKGE